MAPSTTPSRDDPAEPNDRAVAVPKPSAGPPADFRLTFAMFQRAIHTITHELFQLSHEWEDATLQMRYSYADYPVPVESEWPLLPRHVVSLPKAEAFSSSKVGKVVERAHSFLRSQMPFIARLTRPAPDMFADVGHDAFRAFFDEPDLFPMPKHLLADDAAYWADDACFADQFLNGCNPTVVERVASMAQVNETMPVELRALSDPSGRSVEQLVAAGALLVADYRLLALPALRAGEDAAHGSFTNPVRFDAVGLSTTLHKHFYAPYVAFHVQPDGTLGVLGITLTRFRDRPNAVYNARTCAECPNIYTFAKMHVACADNQTHQFYYHLGRCHLALEPFGVAARNVFTLGDASARAHVVGRLLEPHFRDHIAINWLARNTLIASGPDAIPFTDAGFALGAAGGLRFLTAKYSTWRFADQALPAQLRARGFDPDASADGLQYHYRDDGLRVWRALHRYVTAALQDFYAGGDAAVATDPVLQAWCAEMRARDRAAVQSFPARFDGVAQLADAVTTIVYTVSAEHSAVNFAQERYLRYVPNRPNALFRPVPRPRPHGPDLDLTRDVLALKRGTGDDSDVGASMPLAFAFFQVSFAHILSAPPSNMLVDVDAPGVPQRIKDALRRELVEIHESIKARNADLVAKDPRRAPYEFLDPVQIAQSIEI